MNSALHASFDKVSSKTLVGVTVILNHADCIYRIIRIHSISHLAHAPITAYQNYFQFELCGIINRPLKSRHTQWVPVTCQCYIIFIYSPKANKLLLSVKESLQTPNHCHSRSSPRPGIGIFLLSINLQNC